jgi:hypothetical protein
MSGLDALTVRRPAGAGEQDIDENETAALQAAIGDDDKEKAVFSDVKPGLGPESRWQCWRSLLNSDEAVSFCVTLGQSCKGRTG